MWNPLPANLCSAQSYKTTGRVYEVIGGEAAARTRKLPKSLKGKFNVDGHTVVVFPSSQKSTLRKRRDYKKKQVSGRKYGLTRVFFLIEPQDLKYRGYGFNPHKPKLIPVGRIGQSKYCR